MKLFRSQWSSALAAPLFAFFLAACGSSDGGGGNGNGNGFGECEVNGFGCSSDDECCSNYCDPHSEVCLQPAGSCVASGGSCNVGPDCCSFSCVDGTCSDLQCIADNESCSSDGECCGGSCDGGSCTPLSSVCKTSGNPCSSNGECCSGYCPDGTCSPSPSFCRQKGDTCTNGFECCSGMCEMNAGANLGVCALVPAPGAGGCTTAGEVCGDGANWDGGELPVCGGECCSRACFPYGPTGVLICQPPSGCRPTGELCQSDSDCCGSAGTPDGHLSNVQCQKEGDNVFGRCDQGTNCTPAGGICRLEEIQCNYNANCCAGNSVQPGGTCSQDNLGIPRCLIEKDQDCTDPEPYYGEECATSADCCGLPCTQNPDPAGPPLICGEACIPEGGSCTTTADCCAALPCVFPPGETTGVCGEEQECVQYGQACEEDEDCCDNIPCTDGICEIILN